MKLFGDFKVGDRIKIRSWESMEKKFPKRSPQGDILVRPRVAFSLNMKHLCGKKATIIAVLDGRHTEDPHQQYKLDFDDRTLEDKDWYYTEEMMEPLDESTVDFSFKEGDRVLVCSYKTIKDTFEEDGLSGFNTHPYFSKAMTKYCGKTGTIYKVTSTGSVKIKFDDDPYKCSWFFDPNTLVFVPTREEKETKSVSYFSYEIRW